MVLLKGVSKSYLAGSKALDSINLEVTKGEFVFIVGPSGAGKSTLIKLLYREELPSQGQVFVLGRDLTKLRRGEIPFLRRKIGVVFQDFRLLHDRTVEENVAFVLQVTGVSPRDIRKRVTQTLDLVGLRNKASVYPNQLSGGEQQRVAIARALVRGPELLLADEPSGNLDPKTAVEIFKLLERANVYGTTVIVATHAQNIVDSMKKRVIEIRDGRVIRDVRRGAYGS